MTPNVTSTPATAAAGALRIATAGPFARWALVFALLAFATAWNLTKAYHIDDTAYLEIAQWIAGHPLHPMQGTVFWGQAPETIDRINQPHGYMYAMAAWGSVFGWSEIAMHSLMALCALAAITLMYRLARRVVPGRAALATALVTASPAFVVGQNTFVDVPVLALWLLFFALILTGRHAPGRDRALYLLAGVVCGAAILVKYTSLILLPALVLDGLLRRRPAAAYGVAAAAVLVLAWCAFNYWDYGGIHMLSRTDVWEVLDPRKWILCLGAAAPFAFALAAARLSGQGGVRARVAMFVLLGVVGACVATAVAGYAGAIGERSSDSSFVTFFLMGGAALIVLAVLALPRIHTAMPEEEITRWMLAYWAIAAAAFVVLLAPFIAMRHVLLALPPIVLLALLAIPGGPGPRWSAVALVVTFGTTSIVAAADRWYAQVYRDAALHLRDAVPAAAKVWTVGHWGWQWYARQHGMTQFVPGTSRVAAGDFIVYPRQTYRQALPPDVRTVVVQDVTVAPANWVQAFAAPYAGFYQMASFRQLPWAARRGPIEVFRILRVEAAP